MPTKNCLKKVFLHITFWGTGTFSSFFIGKKSKRSHKIVEIYVFLTIFAWWQKDPDPDPYLWLMDPDPGGPKTRGSGFGAGSAAQHWYVSWWNWRSVAMLSWECNLGVGHWNRFTLCKCFRIRICFNIGISVPDPGLYHPGESNHCGSGSEFRNTALFTEQPLKIETRNDLPVTPLDNWQF
jgi:hypothetical protein